MDNTKCGINGCTEKVEGSIHLPVLDPSKVGEDGSIQDAEIRLCHKHLKEMKSMVEMFAAGDE